MKHTLKSLIKKLESHSQWRVHIEGHTDPSGDPGSHGNLSLLRAKNMADFITAKGIDPSRITYRGYSASLPVDRGDTPASMARNRRVVIRVQTQETP